MNDFVTVNGIYEATFGSHKPARSAVEVARLPKDVLVEVECIARCVLTSVNIWPISDSIFQLEINVLIRESKKMVGYQSNAVHKDVAAI